MVLGDKVEGLDLKRVGVELVKAIRGLNWHLTRRHGLLNLK